MHSIKIYSHGVWDSNKFLCFVFRVPKCLFTYCIFNGHWKINPSARKHKTVIFHMQDFSRNTYVYAAAMPTTWGCELNVIHLCICLYHTYICRLHYATNTTFAAQSKSDRLNMFIPCSLSSLSSLASPRLFMPHLVGAETWLHFSIYHSVGAQFIRRAYLLHVKSPKFNPW